MIVSVKHVSCLLFEVILLALGLWSRPVQARAAGYLPADTVIRHNFPAGAAKLLEVYLQPGGTLEVTAWDQPHVSVEVRMTDKRYPVTFPATKGGVAVVLSSPDQTEPDSTAARVRISVPYKQHLRIASQYGPVTVSGVKGEIAATTEAGTIRVSGAEGVLDVSSGKGNILLFQSKVSGAVTAQTGNVSLLDVTGQLQSRAPAGKVQARITPGAVVGAANKPLQLHLLEGDILVEQAPAGAELFTQRGSIVVNSVAGGLVAGAAQGNIMVHAMKGDLDAQAWKGTIEARWSEDEANPAGNKLRLTAQEGDIKLFLPAAVSTDMEVESAQTSAARSAGVESDFAFSPAVATTGANQARYRTLKTRLGQGRNKVTLHATDGNISIKKGI